MFSRTFFPTPNIETPNMTEQITVSVIHRDVDYFTQEKKGEDRTHNIGFNFNKEDSTITRLEKIWRAMNVVEGTELPVRLGIRSMMVHDRVQMEEKIYQVASVGWINAETGEEIE